MIWDAYYKDSILGPTLKLTQILQGKDLGISRFNKCSQVILTFREIWETMNQRELSNTWYKSQLQFRLGMPELSATVFSKRISGFQNKGPISSHMVVK